MKYKLMFSMFLIVLLVGTVSAIESNYEFDNVKNYNEETKTIDIRNSVLGIPFLQLNKIAEYTLLRNTYTCLINCEAEGISTLYMNSSLFQNMRFENRQEQDKDVDFQIYIIETKSRTIWIEEYSDSSNTTLISNKSLTINYEKEIPYNFEELEQGTYRWIIKGTKDMYESIDWIGKSNGVELIEWAWWDALPGDFEAFTSNGTFTVPAGVTSVDVLIIGGGAGGGKCLGGGGGAGGLVNNISYTDNVSEGNEIPVVVGNGGGGSLLQTTKGISGGVSSFEDLTALGGGGGGSWSSTPTGVNGGSGGGGAGPTTEAGGTGTAGQGFDGSAALGGGGGGGGGSTQAGQNTAGSTGGDGGAGNSTVWGLSVLNLSCGGGAGGDSAGDAQGGCASAGDGKHNTFGTHATNQTGSGGGGGGCFGGAFDGGAGGSGLVVVRWNATTSPNINVLSPINQTYNISTIFFNATVDQTITEWIVNYNGTNVTLSDINTTLEVEDGNFSLLLYANGTDKPDSWGLNDTIFFSVDTSPNISVFSPTNTTFNFSTIFFNATNTTQVDKWIVNYNGTNVTLSDINTTLEVEDGTNFNAKFYANGTGGTFGLNDTIFFTVDTTSPQIDITSPTGDQGTFTSGKNLSLRWNVTDLNLNTCFYDYKNSNTTVTCGDNVTNLTVTDSVNTSLRFWVNDSVGHHNSSSTSWSYSFIENNISFTQNISETSSQFFEINLSTTLSVLSITAQLNYNGTKHTSTATCNGTCIVNNTIDIPLVTTGGSEFKGFFWEIDIFNGTDSISVNTSTTQHNVSRVYIETCDASFTTPALNFTTYDEQNLSRLSPYDFEGTFDIWLGQGNVKRNNNFTNLSIIEDVFCILPNATYFTDTQIDYNIAGNNTFYTTRNYYLQNDTISNVSQDIFLYLLNAEVSTSFILKVQDDNLLPLEDHLIKTERYYPGEDKFRVVQIAKTSENGKTIGFFETETVDYRFIISLNALSLLTTSQQKIVGESAPFTLTFTIGENLGKPWQTLENLTDLESSLTYNISNNLVTYTYIDTSGNFTLGTLIIEAQNFSFSTNTVLCNSNSSQSSATIICNMSGNTTGTFIAKGFVTRINEETLISQINFLIQDFIDTVGGIGVLLAWFLILISAFAFKFNEIAGIFMINATVIFVNLIGLVSFGMLSISALIAVSIIIVVVMQK